MIEWRGVTDEIIRENTVLLEDGHGEWEMLVDNPFHEFFMSEVRLTVVGYGIFQALSFA